MNEQMNAEVQRLNTIARKGGCCSWGSAVSAKTKSLSGFAQPASQPETTFPGGFPASESRYSQGKEVDS